jgi:hypothetical protein
VGAGGEQREQEQQGGGAQEVGYREYLAHGGGIHGFCFLPVIPAKARRRFSTDEGLVIQ